MTLIPQSIFNRLRLWANKTMAARKPDITIDVVGYSHLSRWYVIPRNRLFNIYLHRVMINEIDRDDIDIEGQVPINADPSPAAAPDVMHDHPFVNCSVILDGGYDEITPNGSRWHGPGAVIFRRAAQPHRLQLRGKLEAISLYITGPRFRTWGFYTADGWVSWHEFTARHPGEDGPGEFGDFL